MRAHRSTQNEMKYTTYLLIASQLILPIIMIISKWLGDASLSVMDVYVLLSIQIFQASLIVIDLLKKR